MDIEKIMLKISAIAPFVLTILAGLTFVSIAIFFVDYYSGILSPIFGKPAFYFAVLLSLIQEATRFALLVSSIRDFGDKKQVNAYLGLIGSIGLVYHDLKTSGVVAAIYSQTAGTNPEIYSGLFSFLILLGLLLEIRLILTIEKQGKKNPRFVKIDEFNGELKFPKKKVNGNEVYI